MLALTTGFLFSGCDQGSPTTPKTTTENGTDTKTVFVVNYPLQFFVEAVGNEPIAIETPKLDGGHADDFNPTAEEIITIQDADLILLNGAGFSPWAQRASLPSSRVVVTSKAFEDAWIEDTTHHHHDHDHDHDHDDHQHGPDGEGAHHHGTWASFTWLSPALAAQQAQAVGDAMSRLMPEDQSQIKSQTKSLVEGLQTYAARAEKLKGANLPELIAAEPHYQYLQEACGLELHDADWHWEEPEPHDGMKSLEDLVEATGAKYLIIPDDAANLSEERAALLRRLGLTPVTIYPLANTPVYTDPKNGIPDFMMLMARNLENLEALAPNQAND